jgi:rubrerythrin
MTGRMFCFESAMRVIGPLYSAETFIHLEGWADYARLVGGLQPEILLWPPQKRITHAWVIGHQYRGLGANPGPRFVFQIISAWDFWPLGGGRQHCVTLKRFLDRLSETCVNCFMSQPDLAKIIEGMDMTLSEVIREARMSAEALNQAIAGAIPDRKIQLKLEAVLDQPIWSTPDQFKERRNLRNFLGCEPLLLNTAELLTRARQIGMADVPSKARASKDKLITAIAELVQGMAGGKALDPVWMTGRLWRCRACGLIFEPKEQPDCCPDCFKFRIARVGG